MVHPLSNITIFYNKLQYTRFFYISNTFISNARLELAKIMQKPNNTLRLNFRYLKITPFSSTLSSKNNRRHTKKCTKKQMRIFRWCCMINNNENEVENKKINRKDMTQIELGLDMDTNDYAKYKMCLSIMMVICIKQHLRNI